MTGGGFGGCAIALVRSAKAAEMATAVAKQYAVETGLEPQIYICEASAGTSLVPV
jgi:galactokinase